MNRSSSLIALACLAAGLLSGCGADREGKALLVNATGEDGLRLVLRTPEGKRVAGGPLKEAYTFDTLFPDRAVECYVATDGYFEVLRPDDTVLVHHEFATRAVCDGQRITLGPDAALTWD